MKINLLIQNPSEILPDFLNLDIFSDGKDCRVATKIDNLDEYVMDGQAEYIRAINVITFFPPAGTDKILENWVAKLRVGGKILISEVDLNLALDSYQKNTIGLDKFNQLIFATQSHGWDLKKCVLEMNSIVEVLTRRFNLNITKKYYESFNFVVEAERGI